METKLKKEPKLKKESKKINNKEETKTESKTERKEETRTETRTETKTERKEDTKIEYKEDTKIESKEKTKTESKEETKTESKEDKIDKKIYTNDYLKDSIKQNVNKLDKYKIDIICKLLITRIDKDKINKYCSSSAAGTRVDLDKMEDLENCNIILNEIYNILKN
jgi:hypothetical protein